ncbi:glycosyltransferase family 39 protein [Leptospira ilyithenensis]|uniref:Uncharacterized protein n=1 Tax=Leptospira ilyithenensis TaxID=2484901 RepID=A0A4R9LKF6_9LEPT|nr:glycosyltransferase family 39 protein [Leptospira ilyithenensis]TGN08055.1 hypothetical protein EHS11_14050 [Leptospira ilyithenensis]
MNNKTGVRFALSYEKVSLYVIIPVFLLIGIYFRTHNIDIQSLWADELFSVLNSSLPNLSDTLKTFEQETNPPLHGIILHYWIYYFSNSPTSVRSLSAFFGILSLLVLIIKFYFSKKDSDLYSFLFLSASFGAVYYSQEARSYSMLVFFSILTTIWFLKIAKNSSEKRNDYKTYGLFILFGTLASYTHYFGLLYSAHLYFVLSVYLVLKNEFRQIPILITAGVLQLLLYFPEIYKLVFLLPQTDRISWIPSTGIFVFFEIFNYTFFLLPYKGIQVILICFLLYSVSIGINFKAAISYLKDKSNSPTKENLYLLGGVILLFLSTTNIISIYKPVLTGRNLLVLSYPLILFISITIEIFVKPKRNIKLALVCFFSLFFIFSFTRSYYKPFKEHYKQTVSFLLHEAKGSSIYSYGEDRFFNYYFQQMPEHNHMRVLEFPKKENQLDLEILKAIPKGRKIFLVESNMQSVFPEAERVRIEKQVSSSQMIPIWGIKVYVLTK